MDTNASKNSDEQDILFEEYTEIDYVFSKINKIEKMIDNYHDFLNYLWSDEIEAFNNSMDCNLLIDVTKYNTKFNNIRSK